MENLVDRGGNDLGLNITSDGATRGGRNERRQLRINNHVRPSHRQSNTSRISTRNHETSLGEENEDP
jgi:hypothetical protein